MVKIFLLVVFILLNNFSNIKAEVLQTDSLLKTPDTTNIISQENTISQSTKFESPRFKLIEPKPTFSFMNILRGILGLITLIFIAWLFSANRKAISWRLVLTGLGIQLIVAYSVLQIPIVQDFFTLVGRMFVKVLDFTKAGSEFLLGGLLDVNNIGFIFAFQILPTIVFFSALTSVLFYLGIIQKIVYALAWFMTKTLRISGTESLSVAGNIFLGQTEAPLLIKAYLPTMTRSEILLVMAGGMATMAGGVLAAYIGFLGGDDPIQRLIFAKHLLTASIMAAPGAVVVSKILFPQTESIDKVVHISKEKIGDNILDAMANGTGEGIKLAVNVGGMLLVFIAFMALINYIFHFIGNVTNLNPIIQEISNNMYHGLSLQFILGYLFAPLMWLIGVPSGDILQVGQLLGQKIILNEFIGYSNMAQLMANNQFVAIKSIIMATYILCGFANFGSIGIQIGGIGSLAPNQRTQLSKFGLRALLAGALASLFSATLVGMILG